MAKLGQKKRTYLIFPALCTLACSAFAAQCPQSIQTDTSHPNLSNTPEQAIVLESDSLTTQDRNRVHATGDVSVQTPTERLFADDAHYQHDTGQLTLTGNVKIKRNGGTINSTRVDYNVNTRVGDFSDSGFQFPRKTAQPKESKVIYGSAADVKQNAEGVLTLDQATYTTCPSDTTKQPDWALHASQIKLDQNNGIGTAKHMRLHLGSVPVFYWPYINFPINDQRKTGFLFPRFRSNKRNGFTYEQPFYWNIHPNADATFTLAPSTKAGTGLLTQWRYLNRFGTYNLRLDGRDDKASERYKDTRWFGQFTHQGQWQQSNHSHWQSTIDYKRVSDKDYLNDFAAPIDNETHIASTLSVSNTLSNEHLSWQNTLGAQIHQTPDDSIANANKPYDKLPYFNSELQSKNLPVSLNLTTQWAHFVHPTKTNTQRLDVYPSLSHKIERNYGFLTPKIGVRHTQYTRDDQNNASRTTPIVSLDSGLTVERNYTHLIHSISPRAYFLYVPFEDQSKLPNFDTSHQTFSYDNLFSENRFTGLDRQGDAQQVTLGLSNQWQSKRTGITRAKIDIARAFYNEPQHVGLTTTQTDNTDRYSDIAVRSQFGLSASTTFETTGQYNTENKDWIDHRYTLRYHPSNDKQFFAGYRQTNTYNQKTLTQENTLVDLGAHWSVSPEWTLMGLGVYNVSKDREQELSLGIKYKSCCWGVSLVATHELDNNSKDLDDYTQSYLLQFSLDGLASVGRSSDDLTQRIKNR